jgi:hypothetical protein
LTSELVFELQDALKVLVKRLHEDPVPVSSRTELPIPRELDRLVMACLSRSPEARPGAGELATALAAVPVDPWTEGDAAGGWAIHQPLMTQTPRRDRSRGALFGDEECYLSAQNKTDVDPSEIVPSVAVR